LVYGNLFEHPSHILHFLQHFDILDNLIILLNPVIFTHCTERASDARNTRVKPGAGMCIGPEVPSSTWEWDDKDGVNVALQN
jgi:hypothetical protein